MKPSPLNGDSDTVGELNRLETKADVETSADRAHPDETIESGLVAVANIDTVRRTE